MNGFFIIWGLDDFFLFYHICCSINWTLKIWMHFSCLCFQTRQYLCGGACSILACESLHLTAATLWVLFVIRKIKETNKRTSIFTAEICCFIYPEPLPAGNRNCNFPTLYGGRGLPVIIPRLLTARADLWPKVDQSESFPESFPTGCGDIKCYLSIGMALAAVPLGLGLALGIEDLKTVS